MPKFTRQHYNAIAKDIKQTGEEFRNEWNPANALNDDHKLMVDTARLAGLATLQKLSERLAERFELDNPSFDKAAWYAATKVTKP